MVDVSLALRSAQDVSVTREGGYAPGGEIKTVSASAAVAVVTEAYEAIRSMKDSRATCGDSKEYLGVLVSISSRVVRYEDGLEGAVLAMLFLRSSGLRRRSSFLTTRPTVRSPVAAVAVLGRGRGTA
jgi:hypothetical protein